MEKERKGIFLKKFQDLSTHPVLPDFLLKEFAVMMAFFNRIDRMRRMNDDFNVDVCNGVFEGKGNLQWKTRR